jgi:hypothetical protein
LYVAEPPELAVADVDDVPTEKPGAEPVPVSPTDNGELAALPVTVSVALSEPASDGLKTTESEQACPAAAVEPQLLVVVKSAALMPETAMRIEVSGALPGLVRVTVWTPDATPSTVPGKVMLLEERARPGTPTMPMSEIVSGAKLAAGVTVRKEV